MNRRNLLALIGTSPLWLPLAARAEDAFTADQYLLLPLRIHLLRSKAAPDLNSTLTSGDIERITGKVNRIWKQAGVLFYLESVVAEEAAGADLYQGLGENRTEAHLLLTRPKDSRSEQMIHVYYVHGMRPNGICFERATDRIFVKDTSELRRVRGGLDEFLPRVTAHEIGHALGLDHRQDTFNLMASGTTGFTLNEAEVATARHAAEGFPFHRKPAETLAKAEQDERDGARAAAAALYTALAALPDGEISHLARERLSRGPTG